MLGQKRLIGSVLGLALLFVWSAAPGLAQSTFFIGPGLGTVTYDSTGAYPQQWTCTVQWSQYYTQSFTYSKQLWWNFQYNPDSSTGLSSVPIGGQLVYINGSPGTGQGIYDTCPNNGISGQSTISYQVSSGWAATANIDNTGYTVTASLASNSAFSIASSIPGGYINPKWIVAGIIYAPPAAWNTADYTNSTLVSTTQSIDKTFSLQNSVSASLTVGTKVGIKGFFDGTVSTTAGTSYALEDGGNDSSSTTVTEETVNNLKVTGGPSAYAGLDHDWDVLDIWLNPVVSIAVGGTTPLSWNGYGYAVADNSNPTPGIDQDIVHLGCLNGKWEDASAPIQSLINCGIETYGYCDYYQMPRSAVFDYASCPGGDWTTGPMVREWATNSEHFDSNDPVLSSPPTNYPNDPKGYGQGSLSATDLQAIGRMDPWYACTNTSPFPVGGEDWTEDPATGNVVCPSPNPLDNGNDPAGEVESGLAALEAEFTPYPSHSGSSPLVYEKGGNVSSTLEYEKTDSQSTAQGASTTQKFGWELEFKDNSNAKLLLFGGSLDYDLKYAGSYTTTTKTNKQITSQSQSTASIGLAWPSSESDSCNTYYPPGVPYTNYPGQSPPCGTPIVGDEPAWGQQIDFDLYEDNRYGTFLLVPQYYAGQ